MGATRWRSGSYPVEKWKLSGGEVKATRWRSGSYPVVKWKLPGGEVGATRRWSGAMAAQGDSIRESEEIFTDKLPRMTWV